MRHLATLFPLNDRLYYDHGSLDIMSNIPSRQCIYLLREDVTGISYLDIVNLFFTQQLKVKVSDAIYSHCTFTFA